MYLVKGAIGMKRIAIRMATTKDTRVECNRRGEMWQLYFEGRTPPHFSMPSIYCHSLMSKQTDPRSDDTNMLDLVLSTL